MGDVIEGIKMVLSTMDRIKVEGIDNMDKFVGCADILRKILRVLELPESADKQPDKEENDG